MLVTGIYREWSQFDLDVAVASAQSLPVSLRLAALQAILKYRDDLAQNGRHNIALELGGETYAQMQFTREIASDNMNVPSDAWNAVVTDDVDDTLQLRLLIQIAHEWVE